MSQHELQAIVEWTDEFMKSALQNPSLHAESCLHDHSYRVKLVAGCIALARETYQQLNEEAERFACANCDDKECPDNATTN
jgi:hypothetical protein